MARVVTAVLVSVMLGLASSGCAESAAITLPPPPAPMRPAALDPHGMPSWLHPYSPEQLALLEPQGGPVKVAADPIYPLLGHFEYGRAERFESPRMTLRLASFVFDVLDRSPHTYVIGPIRPELENPDAQYGPASPEEPDPWERLGPESSDEEVSLDFAKNEDARRVYASAMRKRDKGDIDGAIAELKYGAVTTPIAPLGIALGDLFAQKGDEIAALSAYRLAREAEPRVALTHIRIAEMHEHAGRREAAKHAIAEALAYHPASRRALEVADRLTGGRASMSRPRVPRFPIFLEVDRAGAVHVGYAGGESARVYAGCRAIMRYEPLVRARLFLSQPNAPYFLTTSEEMLCIEAAIGGYLATRKQDPKAPLDPNMEAMLEIARDNDILGFVMFEILGRRRCERARSAPDNVHRATVLYVEHVVLGGTLVADPQRGMYTAER